MGGITPTAAEVARVTDAQRLLPAPFAALIDALPDGALLADARGRVLHENAALGRALAADADGADVRRAARRFAQRLMAVAGSGRAAADDPARRAPAEEVSTRAARYRLAGGVTEAPALAPARVVVTVVPEAPTPDAAAAVPETVPGRARSAAGFTPREAEAAALLARGLSNAALARALDVSPHTARRHTERVREKLGVHSRAGVAHALRALAGGAQR